MTTSRDADNIALTLFAAELRAARTKAAWSQEELAAQVNYSASLVAMVENTHRVPTLDFAKRCDEALDTAGTFTRLHRLVAGDVYPSWFRPFAHHEAEATALRAFELAVVPGLLQTHDYARALLSTPVGMSEADIDQQVAARLQRQEILSRDEPPLLWVVIDEGVLHRPVGGREVMRAQIQHLIKITERSNVVIQVIPASVGAHDGVNGSFVIADFAGAPSIAYLETALSGMIIEGREQVARLTLTYDGLRTEALSRSASAELLKEVVMTWT